MRNKKEIYKAFLEDWDNYPRRSGNKNNAWIGYQKLVGKDFEKKRKEFLAKTKYLVSIVNNNRYLPWAETWFTKWHDYYVDAPIISKPLCFKEEKLVAAEANKIRNTQHLEDYQKIKAEHKKATPEELERIRKFLKHFRNNLK